MATALRIPDFDVWREGYGGLIVRVYVAGTTSLASLFTSPTMATPINNPITLDELVIEGRSFGKFAVPVYTADPYYLRISNGDQSGIQANMLTTLDGADVSAAIAYALDGEAGRTLAVWLARNIDVLAYGQFSVADGPDVCTDTLNAAIGKAAAQGGGTVWVPSGDYPLKADITLPEGVVLRGAGMSATALQCQNAATFITLGGDGSGLIDITIDGVNVPSNSIGVDGINVDRIRFERVTIRRFAMGLRIRGGEAMQWDELFLSENTNGGLLAGDLDASSTNEGAAFTNLQWRGGAVAFNVTTGLQIKAQDALADNLQLDGVQFFANLGTALKLTGVRDLRATGLSMTSNPIALLIEDNTGSPAPLINTTQRISFVGGVIDGAATGSELRFDGECVAVKFVETDMRNVDRNMSSNLRPILLIDCFEDALCTTQGLTQSLLRKTLDDGGMNVGVTSGAVTATGWEQQVPPGDVWIIDAKVIGRQRDGTGYFAAWKVATVRRPPATLNYMNLVTPYTAGDIITGAASNASARVVSISAPTLSLIDITGTFQASEVLTGSLGGDGRVSGALSTSSAVVTAAGVQSLKTDDDTLTTASCTITVSGGNAQVTVSGVATKAIEWNTDVRVSKS